MVEPISATPTDLTDTALVALEQILRARLKGQFSSLILSFNETSSSNFQSVAAADDDGLLDVVDWVSEEEHQIAREQNSHWNVHWYPFGQTSFYSVSASSLLALLRAFERDGDDK